jgi:hypothetical protein
LVVAVVVAVVPGVVRARYAAVAADQLRLLPPVVPAAALVPTTAAADPER